MRRQRAPTSRRAGSGSCRRRGRCAITRQHRHSGRPGTGPARTPWSRGVAQALFERVPTVSSSAGCATRPDDPWGGPPRWSGQHRQVECHGAGFLRCRAPARRWACPTVGANRGRWIATGTRRDHCSRSALDVERQTRPGTPDCGKRSGMRPASRRADLTTVRVHAAVRQGPAPLHRGRGRPEDGRMLLAGRALQRPDAGVQETGQARTSRGRISAALRVHDAAVGAVDPPVAADRQRGVEGEAITARERLADDSSRDRAVDRHASG